jgi:phosphatidylinositol-3-phosphatase
VVRATRELLRRFDEVLLTVSIRYAVATSLAAAASAFFVGCGGGNELSRPHLRVPVLSHVVFIVFENHGYDQIIGSRLAPTFNRLARTGALLTRYYAVAHPSLPNYLALVSGSTQRVTTDCIHCTRGSPSLADELEASGKTWKVYAEGLPVTGFLGGEANRYAKHHDPFLYFRHVYKKPEQRRRIVPLSELRTDLARDRLPDFSFVVPDMCHDMHGCSVAAGDAWLRKLLSALGPSLRHGRDTIFIVFDESTGRDIAGGGGHVPAWVIGSAVRPGARSSVRLNHYSLLRTVEDAWRLPRLGHSASARPITDIWH